MVRPRRGRDEGRRGRDGRGGRDARPDAVPVLGIRSRHAGHGREPTHGARQRRRHGRACLCRARALERARRPRGRAVRAIFGVRGCFGGRRQHPVRARGRDPGRGDPADGARRGRARGLRPRLDPLSLGGRPRAQRAGPRAQSSDLRLVTAILVAVAFIVSSRRGAWRVRPARAIVPKGEVRS